MNILSSLFPEFDSFNHLPRIYHHANSIVFVKPDLLYHAIATPPPFVALYTWEGTPEDPIDPCTMLWFNEPPAVEIVWNIRLSPLAVLQSSTAVLDAFSPYPDEPLPAFYNEQVLSYVDDRPVWQRAKDPNTSPRRLNGTVVVNSGRA